MFSKRKAVYATHAERQAVVRRKRPSDNQTISLSAVVPRVGRPGRRALFLADDRLGSARDVQDGHPPVPTYSDSTPVRLLRDPAADAGSVRTPANKQRPSGAGAVVSRGQLVDWLTGK